MGHGSGCFPSGHKKADIYNHRTYQGRVDDGYVLPAYATYDDTLPKVRGSAARMSIQLLISSTCFLTPWMPRYDKA